MSGETKSGIVGEVGRRRMKCVCKKCGKVNVFPEGINPEIYGWIWMPDDTMYCFRCHPEGGGE